MSDSTRERILRAATALVEQKGLGALSVRAAAAAAGVGATTLRNYFPSQALLHQAVAAEFVTHTLEDRRINDSSLSPIDRLQECLEQFLPAQDDAQASLEGWLEYYRLSFGPDAVDAVRALLATGRRASAKAVENWLGVLRDEGHRLRADIPDQATAILVVIDGLHLTMLTDPERLDLVRARKVLRTAIETSVFIREGDPQQRT